MNKLLKYTDRGLGCLVTILGIFAALFIGYYIFHMLAQVIGSMAFNLNRVLMVMIMAGLLYLYYLHPKLKNKESNNVGDGNRIILTLIGLFLLGVLYSFPQPFRVYNDGTYCARVEYETINGSSAVYMPVIVENGEVIKLFWSNGGYLDEKHFSGAIVEGDGSAYFTDDRDRSFYIELLTRGGGCDQ